MLPLHVVWDIPLRRADAENTYTWQRETEFGIKRIPRQLEQDIAWRFIHCAPVMRS
jgi:hypothetical protein